MKRSWYSDMLRLARRVGEPAWSFIAVVRAKAHWKARKRMKVVVGVREDELPDGGPFFHTPILNKRSGKVVGLRIGRKFTKRSGKLVGIRVGHKPKGKV